MPSFFATDHCTFTVHLTQFIKYFEDSKTEFILVNGNSDILLTPEFLLSQLLRRQLRVIIKSESKQNSGLMILSLVNNSVANKFYGCRLVVAS